MTKLQLQNVMRIGRYYYFRRAVYGKDYYQRLPDIASDDFLERYVELSRSSAPRLGPAIGTFRALLSEYRKSVAYRELRASSRRQADYYGGLIAERFGDIAVIELTTPMIYKLQSELRQTPGTANSYISHLSTLLKLGTRIGFCSHNASVGVRRMKLGEHQPWPAAVLERAMAAASPMDRLAIITGLASAQRISDCIRIRHDQMGANVLELRQLKTGKQVFIPVHPRWREEIARVPVRAESLLYDRCARPFSSPDPLQLRIRTLMRSIGAGEYSFHGLRKNATNYLAELGLSAHEIAAVTGMSLKTIVHYSKGVETKKIAKRIAPRVLAGQHFRSTGLSEIRRDGD